MTGPLRDLALALGFSVHLVRARIREGRWRTDARERDGRVGDVPRRAPGPRILVHGVSVGETNALAPLVAALAASERRPDMVVSASTTTGVARARQLHAADASVAPDRRRRNPEDDSEAAAGPPGPDAAAPPAESHAAARPHVVRFPLDFTWMVRRFLDNVRPALVVLGELELWPSFLAECARRGIPVCVAGGRLSARSHRGYRAFRPLFRGMFSRLAMVAAQTEAYRERFVDLGARPGTTWVSGSLKWDAARQPPDPGVVRALAEGLGIDPERPLVVAGSTGPGEEEALLAMLDREGDRLPPCQLLLAPRRPERWDEVAALVPGMPRRSVGRAGDSGAPSGTTSSAPGPAASAPGPAASAPGPATSTPGPAASAPGPASRSERGAPPRPRCEVLLLDTLGELTAAYALASAVFVGRSLLPLGGSNPIEPVALGRPVVIGPHFEHFAGVVADLERSGGIVVSAEPARVIRRWLVDPARARQVADAGARALQEHAGAARSTAARVLGYL